MNRQSVLFFAETIICGTILLAQSGIASEKEKKTLAIQTVGKQEDDRDCEVDIPADTLAVVNGVIISRQEVDEKIKARVTEIQQSLFDARVNELYLKINSRLLEQEARGRGTDTFRLLQDEVLSKVKGPTEEEALAFYNENRNRLQEEFYALKEQIINYLLKQRQSEGAKKFAERLRSGAHVQTLSDYSILSDVTTDPASVLAEVNGEKITLKDIDEKLRPEIFKVQEQLYELRKGTVDLLINDLLLNQEAQKRNVSVQELLDAEVTSKLKKITKKDALAFYMENKEKINTDHRNSMDRVRIVQYMKQREEERGKSVFLERLRQGAAIEVYLAEPKRLVEAISVHDQPSMGREDAPVTIVEFIDYECPTCANLQEVLKGLMEEYGDKVRVVAFDFPLQRHAYAYQAAIAAEAAREQGKYWEYITILFRNQGALEVDNLKEYASRLGLNRKKFDEELDTEKFADKVKRDRQEALRLGLNSTPTVFVNGLRVAEKTRESLKAAIETALRQVAIR